MNVKHKALLIAGISLTAGTLLLFGCIGIATVVTHYNTDDVSLTHAIDRCMDTKGTIRVGEDTFGQVMGTWVWDDVHRCWEWYDAHIQRETFVMERYLPADGSGKTYMDEPTENMEKELVNVYYYSVLDVSSVSFTEGNVLKFWCGGKI